MCAGTNMWTATYEERQMHESGSYIGRESKWSDVSPTVKSKDWGSRKRQNVCAYINIAEIKRRGNEADDRSIWCERRNRIIGRAIASPRGRREWKRESIRWLKRGIRSGRLMRESECSYDFALKGVSCPEPLCEWTMNTEWKGQCGTSIAGWCRERVERIVILSLDVCFGWNRYVDVS